NEKLGYKIRHWKTQKVPYILVAGKQEVVDGTVNVNQRGVDEKRTVLVESFVDELHTVVEAKQ
ncbi:MAG TPA: His/Gly/Thr/Pro-type tRNA ligase C-terminal domain-containing protein, partial [Candidatus Nitrosotalea sp.]|nr:His/Gly/Thr/Pro-type tRNA ligase C-terminal domain-containing protein [Candidatus Nitrosotalea sp.]